MTLNVDLIVVVAVVVVVVLVVAGDAAAATALRRDANQTKEMKTTSNKKKRANELISFSFESINLLRHRAQRESKRQTASESAFVSPNGQLRALIELFYAKEEYECQTCVTRSTASGACSTSAPKC